MKINNEAYHALKRDGVAAQGDLLIVNINLMRVVHDDWEIVHSADGGHTVAHSETGHHHRLEYAPQDGLLANMRAPTLYRDPKAQDKEMRSVVVIDEVGPPAQIVHLRGYDRHETHILPPGTWVLLRQGRPTPEGWQKVTD